ncbi:NDxxF motif lipoprotein [Staphylococcus sp. SQ8-PEA]|uniref:NDxxF motif lipoprotein n=1 Tax=Staphylococcus marylandisciuri TaxID=2981529 RepID=A0ABT2QRE7_9STAP|nr:NDxxF motif lipoprotein [Staphylococcus marylandisciuri]MCU5746517.1 NDxxF motif lipoprotein [Staphylococcus marylandisciuri]
MKKYLILGLICVLTLALAACGHSGDDDNGHSSKHAPKNVKKLSEKDIFQSKEKGKKLSQEEMNSAIQKYVDINSDILDNKYLMQYKLDKQYGSDKKITDKQADQLSKLSHLSIKNDVRFKKYVENNTLPKGYKEDVDRIIKYFTALNSTIKNADEDIEELDYQPQNELNVVDVSTKYAGDVNGKQQDKIKKFLKSKNIKTDAVDK